MTFPQLQRGVSEEQQTIESDSQASTGIINNCKSCWWTWGNRGTVGRYAQRKIHLNEPNQSNIHQAFCALCQAQTTLEPYRNTCGRKTAKHQNTSGTEEQEDGVLPRSWRPPLSRSRWWGPVPGPAESMDALVPVRGLSHQHQGSSVVHPRRQNKDLRSPARKFLHNLGRAQRK